MAQKQKIKWKLNIFDVIIILLALAALLVGYNLLNADRGGGALLTSGREITVRYTIELANMPIGASELITPGDSVIEVVEKRAVGSVVSCESYPYRMTSPDRITGNTILAEVPGRESAAVTIELRATETEHEINANGFVLCAGTALSVTGPGWAGSGLILSIERAEG